MSQLAIPSNLVSIDQATLRRIGAALDLCYLL